ncbi:MAG: HD domain-containing phosphohydrolase [Vicinamibacterales bacterium]
MRWHLDRLRSHGLKNRVARRIAVLFVACTLVPMAGFALVTVRRTSRYLERAAADRLRAEGKAQMMEALARIEWLDRTLRVLGAAVATDPTGRAAGRLDDVFQKRPSVLTYGPDGGAPVVLGAPANLPTLSKKQRGWLVERRALIVPTDAAAPEQSGDLLVVPVEGGSGVMVATLDYAWAFSLDDPDSLPADMQFCLHRSGRLIACSPRVPAELVAASSKMEPNADAVLGASGEPVLARSRMIPLQVGYMSEPLTLVAMQPSAVALQPAREYLRDFWWVALASLLSVSLLVLSQVRRQMQPLVALMDATRRLATRRFGSQVSIVSGDEFEELGTAFNQMSGELKRQFDELEAFSLGALEAMARAVDAKSPWTAGHSSRVTELAVAIAQEMSLPEEEIEQLRRGGLVHDIGKLATPPEILDKASRLTPEELTIMRRHPMQGVHILEPVIGFEPLLPIVAQHHERWDGGGYPHGLAGNAIARTARVLAVADVFDAMQSDRPYRAGRPLQEVVSTIHSEGGQHFDPAVVEAFVRLAGERGERLADHPRLHTRLGPVEHASSH